MDPRVEKLAEILTNWSVKINEGDYIVVKYGLEAKPLAHACFKNILKKGANPVMQLIDDDINYTYYQLASDKQLQTPPMHLANEAEKASGWINLYTQTNTREMTNVDPKKIAMRRRVIVPIHDKITDKNNWVLFEWPTKALAQDAEMSLEEFEDFVFNASLIDWQKEEKRQEVLQKVMNEGKQVRIVSKDTDITFSIEGREGVKCCGKRNMPDGEVFIAPVETSTEGYVSYSYPTIYGGREVDGIKLWFEKGKVVKATASKNEEFLKEMIATDEGAAYLGEWGFATNYTIKRPVKQILFDEKIGGTIHLALGRAYKQGGGKNVSALHWDMILDLRQGGKVFIDGKLIQENGAFVIDL